MNVNVNDILGGLETWLGLIIACNVLVVILVVVVVFAILNTSRQTERTAEAVEWIAQAMSAQGAPVAQNQRPAGSRGVRHPARNPQMAPAPVPWVPPQPPQPPAPMPG